MLILGLNGSPRKNGNTEYLVNTFLSEAEALGAHTRLVKVCDKKIEPCRELMVCEKKGFCPLRDDMETDIYPLMRAADIIVIGTPIFFYSTTAQLKALIDRSQTFWARKYRLNLTDPKGNRRKGFFLAVGATKGKNLFEGVHLTMKYFYDAVGAEFAGSLTYRRIEHPGDIKKHPDVSGDIRNAVKSLVGPMLNRTKILFACVENACRSQMASAFAQMMAGDRIEAYSAGSRPAGRINAVMADVMGEKGIDMAYRIPTDLDAAVTRNPPDVIVNMGCGEACPFIPGCRTIEWDIPDPAEKPVEVMRHVRDEIEKKVTELVREIVT
ncbi:MAG: NAD(P)H-dependent oxidoreductase [Desulfobacterales bacterium]